jgi:hypothetical protein
MVANSPRRAATLLAIVLALAGGSRARASCGAENCPLDMRSGRGGVGAFSLDLTWQYVRQDQVRVGTRAGVVGQLPSPENEVSTLSRVTSLLARAEVWKRLSLSATLPFVDRTHRHIRNEEGLPPAPERWDYSGLGDLQVLADWRVTPADAALEVTLQGGAKAPTGRRHVAAVDGDEPEPAARPGTGSWDLLAGVHVMHHVTLPELTGGDAQASFFTGVLVRRNGAGTEEYRVGDELQLSMGGSYPLAGPVQALGQINARFRGRDEPGLTDALAANTGSSAVFVSPGLRCALSKGLSAYGYVQLPVYQRVNRIQIVAPWLLYTGVSWSPGAK